MLEVPTTAIFLNNWLAELVGDQRNYANGAKIAEEIQREWPAYRTELQQGISPTSGDRLVKELIRKYGTEWRMPYKKQRPVKRTRTQEPFGSEADRRSKTWQDDKHKLRASSNPCDVIHLGRLRRNPGSLYRHVTGECYVHGVMDGEAPVMQS